MKLTQAPLLRLQLCHAFKRINQEPIYISIIYKHATPDLTPAAAAAPKSARWQVRIGHLSHFRRLRAVRRELRGDAAGAETFISILWIYPKEIAGIRAVSAELDRTSGVRSKWLLWGTAHTALFRLWQPASCQPWVNEMLD